MSAFLSCLHFDLIEDQCLILSKKDEEKLFPHVAPLDFCDILGFLSDLIVGSLFTGLHWCLLFLVIDFYKQWTLISSHLSCKLICSDFSFCNKCNYLKKKSNLVIDIVLVFTNKY